MKFSGPSRLMPVIAAVLMLSACGKSEFAKQDFQATAIAGVAAFVWVERRAHDPIVDARLFFISLGGSEVLAQDRISRQLRSALEREAGRGRYAVRIAVLDGLR